MSIAKGRLDLHCALKTLRMVRELLVPLMHAEDPKATRAIDEIDKALAKTPDEPEREPPHCPSCSCGMEGSP